MRKSTIVTAGALTASLLVLPGAALASNGHAWLLGAGNTETKTTTVTNSAGTPLSLHAKSGYAPLAVNSSKTVTKLSSDYLDGLSSGSFARVSGKTGTIVHDGTSDAKGAHCPSGTVFVSGGGISKGIGQAGANLVYSGPDWDANTEALIPNSWLVLDNSGYATISFVTCYSPSGAAIHGAATTLGGLTGASTTSASSSSYHSAAASKKASQFRAVQAK